LNCADKQSLLKFLSKLLSILTKLNIRRRTSPTRSAVIGISENLTNT